MASQEIEPGEIQSVPPLLPTTDHSSQTPSIASSHSDTDGPDDAPLDDIVSGAAELSTMDTKDDTSAPNAVTCSECSKKRRKTGAPPFGRKPVDENAVPRVRPQPKTHWGKWQRKYMADYSKERPEAACALARITYIPTHSDGRPAPKSYERMLRETYAYLDPEWKSYSEDKAADALRQWVQNLLATTILNFERSHKLVPQVVMAD